MAATRPIRRRNRPWVRRLKRTLWFLSFAFFVVLAAGLAVYIPIYQEAVDDAGNIENRLIVKNEDPTVILSADHKILYSVAAVRRKVIDLNDPKYPTYLRYAIVAAEDRRFYDHRGVDPMGLARAVFKHGTAGGGSTISMQLAKNFINGDDRSLRRKLKDIATAQQIEALKSKDEILNLYANSSYFGQHAFGIERASEVYFGKSADKLTVGEAAMLARCVRLPSRMNPVRNLQKMLPLRDYVLNVMKEEGWITQGQYDEGVREVPKIVHLKSNGETRMLPEAGYFVQHVRAQLDADFPGVDFESGGYTIQTSLNYALQKAAIHAVRQVISDNQGHKVNDGAIVVMDPQGRILCEVGGPDYEKRQYNVITQGRGRQPGSAFKAFVYTVAMKNGIVHPGSYISNARIHIKQDRHKYWDPDNASPRENASGYTLESAFAYSINRPAIHTILDTGVRNVVAGAHDIFGIKSHLGEDASLALGTSDVKPIEMLEAYSVFMLGGNRVEPQPIVRVLGPGGEEVRRYDPVVHEGVLDPQIAQQMDEVLKGPVWMPGGTATFAQAIPNSRGKTGTTNDAKDAWFCGYVDGLVGVGWVGNSVIRHGRPSALPMSSSVFGGTVTVKIWTAVMQSAERLGLAKGLRTAPSTSVSASEATDEKVDRRPRADDGDSRPDPGQKVEPPTDPVTVEPSPESKPPVVPPIASPDNNDPSKGDPPQTDPPQTDPPQVDPSTSEPEVPPSDPPRRHAPTHRNDPPRRRDAETEEVDVCVDTGMKANAYCPETVTRRFPKGRGPKKYCTLHHA